MRGIYVDASDDIEAVVLAHAVRIAQYLYPNAYLSVASAVQLAPSRDGQLFLSGRRAQRTRIRALEIIQNVAPKMPSLGSAIVQDSLGQFPVDVSSIRQRFLEAFRLRSEHAASIDAAMRESLAARLVAEYGSPKFASDAVWALARENEWYKEGEGAERFLLRSPVAIPAGNQALLDLTVAWHGSPIGQLVHDGFEWRWSPGEETFPPLIRQTTPGRLPPFIVSLLPEGWLQTVLKNRDERTTLRSGKRYMSNITIVEKAQDASALPRDIFAARLVQYTTNGLFTGRYEGPGRSKLEETFEQNLAQIYEQADTPRLSGIQIKAPMYLDAEGRLSPSTGTPFTHILKPAGTGGFEALPLVEWTALTLGRAVGFDVPACALIEMPNGMPPALIVERFDIRERIDDDRLIAMEDLCSVLDLPPQSKYDGTMEQVARAVRPLSTSPENDLLTILRRALFAWLIADGDMHLKNMALLKEAKPGSGQFSSVRFAPLYDAVTTRVFPRLEGARMALKLNGKDDRMRRSDFQSFASTAGLRASDADQAIDDLLQRLRAALDVVALPELSSTTAANRETCARMLDLCREQIAAFA
ncbi:MAG: type II toxin-antitoxin system HipA family toxin [Variovorax sp.]